METLLMKFVERVLYVWDSSDIKEFVIDFDVKCDASRVKSWITAAIVNITDVTFPDGYTTRPAAFSGLPVLEMLCLEKCKWGCLKVLSISAPKLSSLTIIEDDMQNPTDSDCCQKLMLVTLMREQDKLLTGRMFKVLTGLPNVKDLELQGSGIEVLTYAAELLPNMPIFNNLMYLELASLSLDCAAVLKILQNSPCLRTLNFIEIDCENDDIILDPVPPCFFSDHESIEVIRSSGDKEELSVLKILLKNAVAYSLFIDVPVPDTVFGVSGEPSE
ncbi:uncharacterized protein LOC132170102 [Corylus avellana]|uniref:uncharacterized protein LOC132170102 n=1 Tax=Corylus avellana TaxID=13451 RepID=UPI00286A0059|nr:uncharacterized protein LOC132170102 [Corylus avellana]